MISIAPGHAPEMNQKEFAALLGKSEPMVVKWKQKGRLVMTDDGKRVCVAESVARINAGHDPGRGGDRTLRPNSSPSPTAGPPAAPAATLPLNYQDEAARDKRASARQRELELAASAGAVVAAERVEHRIAGLVRAAIDQLASSRRRLAPALAMEADPRKVEQLLAERDREFCTKVAALVSRETSPAEREA